MIFQGGNVSFARVWYFMGFASEFQDVVDISCGNEDP